MTWLVILSRLVLKYCKHRIYVLMTSSRKVFNCFFASDHSRGKKFTVMHDDIDHLIGISCCVYSEGL